MRFGPRERRWARIFRPDPRPEVEEELAFHLEQRVRDYEAQGLDPEAARVAARRRLGDLEDVRGECTELLESERRTEKRREWMKVSWLDFKLGFRMLVRYPGLTVVGGLAIAFGIWVGAGTFELMTQVGNPSLPFPDGDRIVGIRNYNVARDGTDNRALHDYAIWREQLQAVDDVGAFRTVARNLTTPEGATEPVELAEISPSAFRITGVRPLLGRVLQEQDEQPGAPPVAVIGERLWESRFESDPDVVGTSVRLGAGHVTIVGVMPEDYEFPVAHGMWVPLRLNPLDHERGDGPSVQVFGRLAEDATLEEAQAELSVLGTALATEFPETNRELRPQVMPYPRMILDVGSAGMLGLASINLFVVLLLVLICSNVALLMFARAATRESEIVVRNALGASRGRIIMQLFAEALVLGGFAALVGLSAASAGLEWLIEILSLEVRTLPFWLQGRLSPVTIGYAVLLTLLVAVIAGVMPALKVTRGLQQRLRDAAAGGGLQFAGIWSVVIVVQVAVTVAFPVVTFTTQQEASDVRSTDLGFPAEEYLAVRLEMDREPLPGEPVDSVGPTFTERFHRATRLLQERLAAQPAVAGVAAAELLPRMYHPHRLIGVDAGGAEPLHPEWPAYRVSSADVDVDYFEVLQTPIVAGRGFHNGDVAAGDRVVVINQTLAKNVFGTRNPLGRRIRYEHFEEWEEGRSFDDQPWYEIVGVVADPGMRGADPKAGRMYHPLAGAALYPLNLAVHVRGDPLSVARQVRTIAAQVDPRLRLYGLLPMSEASEAELKFMNFWLWMSFLLSAVALLLSLAAIYAVMSFTVARRTREIGIRAALGADRLRIARDIFRRPAIQVGLGILVGGLLVAGFVRLSSGTLTLSQGAVVAAYALVMLGVCMLACVAPTRRALGISPTEAMRADG